MAGRVSQVHPADDRIHTIVTQVKDQIGNALLPKLPPSFTNQPASRPLVLTPVSYTQQVVRGMMYSIRIQFHLGNGGGTCVVRVWDWMRKPKVQSITVNGLHFRG